MGPPEPVLEAIARFLRLTPDQKDHVDGLAQRAGRRTPPRPQTKPVRPQLQRLLDQLPDTPRSYDSTNVARLRREEARPSA